MRFASHDASDDQRNTKCFTSDEFRRVQRSMFFLGCVSFWRQLERLSDPEPFTRLHAMGVLREMARSSLEDCEGLAFSLQHAGSLGLLRLRASRGTLTRFFGTGGQMTGRGGDQNRGFGF